LGRAALGAAAKDKTGSVRVTFAQFRWFAARYGSLGRFLQLKVNEELRRAEEAGEL
jgi:hypothetical protein